MRVAKCKMPIASRPQNAGSAVILRTQGVRVFVSPLITSLETPVARPRIARGARAFSVMHEHPVEESDVLRQVHFRILIRTYMWFAT